jgi:hypothetical protein
VVEARFHFFVMIRVITLHQDWLPFGLALGSVAYLVNWRLSEQQAVEISRLVSRLEGLARTDPLTGVPNRPCTRPRPRAATATSSHDPPHLVHG